MRLSRIKLAGFKSFVDPTTIPLPSNLLAIVGPNGCGKSNVIDAVRWVMGEGSAKILRGESMADVIFNGSNARKPVGTATVELTFDNADGAIGGQYAGYAEISVKRVVSRDGHSQYFLNGTRCRRRDITDLFLGTGLGPRSYSIIEQGMISQVVEARPEDLRAYLEEAAGISKYKERRRETENRIRHTRENLARLDDLREELSKQLAHLKRQARAAERYSKLKQEHRRTHAEALSLRWRGLKRQLEAGERRLAAAQNQLEALISEQRTQEAALEKAREDQHQANEEFNRVQGELYEVGAEVARLEQAMQHVKELRAQQEQELAETEAGFQELNDHIALDEVQVAQLQSDLKTKAPEQERASRHAQTAALRLQEVEAERTQWQQAWDTHTEAAGRDARDAEVARTRIDHLDRELARLGERRERMQRERGENDTGRLETEQQRIVTELSAAEREKNRLQDELAQRNAELRRARLEVDEHAENQDALRRQLQESRGRLSSLEALQQAALGGDDAAASEWLTQQGLDDARRLAEALEVESGWETAVETVLGAKLRAVLCDDTRRRLEPLAALEQGQVMLADRSAAEQQASSGLAAKVKGPAVIAELLGGVHCAETVSEAQSLLPRLEPGESVVSRSGEWLGRGWAGVGRGQDTRRGIIKRDREINRLKGYSKALIEEEKQLSDSLAQARAKYQESEQGRDDLQEQANAAHRRHADLSARLESHGSSLEQAKQRLQQIHEEDQTIRQRLESSHDELRKARGELEALTERMAEQESVRRGLLEHKQHLDESYAEARRTAAGSQSQLHDLTVTVERLRTSLGSTDQALERMRTQLKHLQTRRAQLQSHLDEADRPLQDYQAQLKQQLDLRLETEQRLNAARNKVESVDERLRELDQNRVSAEKSANQAREALQQEKLDQQRLSVKQEDLTEQISETGFDAAELVNELPEEADADDWQQRLEKLGLRIQRLEPVNLAAISEYEEQSERKEYLDRQNADLMEALETLESAIRKIDRQTRTGFRETFDRVNTGLKELFPRLFGGGHAYLEMTGDDLLTTGITIMARPPGKRIAHIHLLSGGEKALTAVAFVFAIFLLNPAPFCLLDEVDAPLDDANVGRFSDLVREMSEKVQFVVVTHNKGTMETAHQLTGVTMREAGVSRLVSVDIDEAAQMASA